MAEAAARITGPVTGGAHGWPFGASPLDVAELGYVEQEYFLDGTATRFRPAPGAPWGADGHWRAEPVSEAPFKTRLIVYRPRESERFNGTVILTWNNVTAGYDLFGADSRELFEGGFALACLTTQMVGITGLPPLYQGLANWDPERYGGLSIPSDDYSYDVFTQAARALGAKRDRSAPDPMGGLDVERVVAQGASQSAGRLATYVNAIQPLTGALDGFILTIYFGRGSPLEVGDAVVDLDRPAESRTTLDQLKGENRLRDDQGTPIFVVNSELEAIACHGVRQPDTETFRYWEVAGTCHTSQQTRAIRQRLLDRDGVVARPALEGINAIPLIPVFDAAFHHMQVWLADGTAPPVQPKIEFRGDPPEVARDAHGIATGGVRLPQADVPLATNSAIPLAEDVFALLGGSCRPFEPGKVNRLYGNLENYLARFEAAAERAIGSGALLPRDVAGLVAEARDRWPG